jgi:hypothetical protein
MSVREKPVANRYLDLRWKDASYRKHVNAIATGRSGIDTTQPDVPRRLMVAAVTNHRHRKSLLRTYDDHDQMIAAVVRPRTSAPRSHRREPVRAQTARETEVRIFDYDCGSGRQYPTTPFVHEPPVDQRDHRVVRVRIGYEADPIIETDSETTSY